MCNVQQYTTRAFKFVTVIDAWSQPVDSDLYHMYHACKKSGRAWLSFMNTEILVGFYVLQLISVGSRYVTSIMTQPRVVQFTQNEKRSVLHFLLS